MSKRAVLVIVVVVVAIVIGVRRWSSPDAPRPAAAAAGTSPTAAGAAADPGKPAAGSTAARPATGADDGRHGDVRRLSRDERRQLGERIAEARQRARAAAASTGGSEGDDIIPIEEAKGALKAGMESAIHMLAECYKQLPGADAMREAAAQMTLTSDPDLGTVIDTSGITDAAGQQLPAKLDECMRDTIDSLVLPPLPRGGVMKVQYTFKFD